MIQYVFRRIIFFIPALFVLSLLAFAFNALAPGDPVDRILKPAEGSGAVKSFSGLNQQRKIWREKLGLNLPLFYFSMGSVAAPDTMYRINVVHEREALERLTANFGNWEYISDYYLQLKQLQKEVFQLHLLSPASPYFSSAGDAQKAFFEVTALLSAYQPSVIESKLKALTGIFKEFPEYFKNRLSSINNSFRAVQSNASKWKVFIPAIDFHLNNQYHRWLFGDGNIITGRDAKFSKGLVRGDFGISYATGQPVAEIIRPKLFWSALLVFLAMIISYSISIPIGIKAAADKSGLFSRVSGIVLFMMYSMPSFWLAILLLMIFANTNVLGILPASGIGPPGGIPDETGFWKTVAITAPYLVLPVIAFSYGSLAFLSRVVRSSLVEVLGKEYIKTARAKGLSARKVIIKHGLKNALLPVITVFANILPLTIGGAVIIESIFSIPGMGHEILSAVYNRDYPVIIAVFLISGLFTMTGYLIGDLLYVWADPRIKYGKE